MKKRIAVLFLCFGLAIVVFALVACEKARDEFVPSTLPGIDDNPFVDNDNNIDEEPDNNKPGKDENQTSDQESIDTPTIHIHNFGEWKITKTPTCTEEGKKERSCDCGKTEEEILSPIKHSFVEGVCAVCGKGFSYVIKEDGTYEIKGYNGGEKDVVIPATYKNVAVTSIGECAFLNCSALSIEMPDTITEIKRYAFDGCNKLKKIEIGKNVARVGQAAFFCCTSAEEVFFPHSLKSVGLDAFETCYGLKKVKYAGTMASWCGISFHKTEIEGDWIWKLRVSNPLSYANVLYIEGKPVTDFVVPDDVTCIKKGVFDGIKLNSLTLPASLQEIEEDAFGNGYRIINPSGEELNKDKIGKIIYKGKFLDWFSVNFRNEYSNPMAKAQDLYIQDENVTEKDIIIPADQDVGAYAFYGLKGNVSWLGNLTSVSEKMFFGYRGVNISLPDSVTSIGEKAFGNCANATSIYLPDGIMMIGKNAFSGCDNLSYTEYDHGCYLGNASNPYVALVKLRDTTITSFLIHEGTVFICSEAFNDCSALKDITIPDTVKGLGEDSFRGCSIETATLPAIACIHIRNKELKTVVVTSGEKIGDSAFTSCVRLKSITLPTSIKTIDRFALSECTDLESIEIPSSVTHIGEFAFERCASLKNVSVPSSLTSIEDSIFSRCENLQYNVYDNAYYLGNKENPYVLLMKAKNEEITSCAIPEKTKVFYQDAFYGCDSLTGVYYEGDIGAWCDIFFANMTSNPLAYTENLYIDNLPVTEIVLPNTVTVIKANAFGCWNGVSITIPISVKKMEKWSFYACNYLESVYYEGNQESWMNIEMDGVQANPLWYAHNLYIDHELVTDFVIPPTITRIGNQLSGGHFQHITIPDSIEYIADNAFSNLNKVVKNEYDNAYYIGNDGNPFLVLISAKSSNISSCVINDKTKFIVGFAFGNCKQITDISIPDSVVSIGGSAFWGCEKLRTVSLSQGINEIRERTFYLCSSLQNIILPETVTTIRQLAFSHCYSLTSFTIPERMAEIEQDAFEYCFRLVEIRNKSLLNLRLGAISRGRVAYYAKIVYKDEQTSNIVEKGEFTVYLNGDEEYLLRYNGIETILNVPETIIEINAGALIQNDVVTDVILPEGLIQIGERSFSAIKTLKTITLPHSLKKIDKHAFFGCEQVTDIYYNGTAEEWENVSKGEEWSNQMGKFRIHCLDADIANE